MSNLDWLVQSRECNLNITLLQGVGIKAGMFKEISNCLKKYEDNHSPPANRIRDSYYRTGELCIPVLMTIAAYSERASGMAEPNEIVLISGHEIADFIAYRGIGFINRGSYCQFSGEAFKSYVSDIRYLYKYQT